jgi:hypothetical protein
MYGGYVEPFLLFWVWGMAKNTKKKGLQNFRNPLVFMG